MKIFFFVLFLFSMTGCLPEADISISKMSDVPNSNINGQAILSLKYNSKGSGSLVADQIEVGTSIEFRPTTTGGAPTSFSITPSLPSGLNFNTADGTISGSPTGYFAPTLFTVKAMNDFGFIDQNVTLGSSYGSFAITPTVDSVSVIYGNRNVALGVKVEFNILSGVAGTYSCKIETITGDDLTTVTGISYNSNNCKIESTATPTIQYPHHTTFFATLTRTEDNQTASSSISIQIFNNPVISSFTIENGQGPGGLLDSRGGRISVTGINFEAGDEFYDSTNPSSEILLNGSGCSTYISSTSIKCDLLEISPGTRKFKIKRSAGISNEEEFTIYNTAPTIEILTGSTFPTNSQKAYAYNSFPFDTTIDFKISTGPTEAERNAESSVLSLSLNKYGAPQSFIDWQMTHCNESSLSGGFKKLSCTLKPDGERAYGFVNLKLSAYEALDPLKTTTIDGDYVRYPFDLLAIPAGTLTKGVDPLKQLTFSFKIASIDQFKNLLEITGGYSSYLSETQTNGIRNRNLQFTFENLDFTDVHPSFLEFLDLHKESKQSSGLQGEILGDCNSTGVITSFPISQNSLPVSWFDTFRGKINCLKFDQITWVAASDLGEIQSFGLISNNAILEGGESHLKLTAAAVDWSNNKMMGSGVLFGGLSLNSDLKIDSSSLSNGVLNLSLKNALIGSGTWASVGFIAGTIDGAGKIYGHFGGKIDKNGGSESHEKFGLISGELSAGFGIPASRSFIRGELDLRDTNSYEDHGLVGVVSGIGSNNEIKNTQLVSSILSSGKNSNEAGIYGYGQAVSINDVVNDVHFIQMPTIGNIKGAGSIGTSEGLITFNDFNTVVMGTDDTKEGLYPIAGGILISNCSMGGIYVEKTYVVTNTGNTNALMNANNCTINSTSDQLYVVGTNVLTLAESIPLDVSLASQRTTLLLAARLSDLPSWLTNCVSTNIYLAPSDILYGFCVGKRTILPTGGSYSSSETTFLTHFSEVLALSTSSHFFDGGHFTLGDSINLQGLTNFYLANEVNQSDPFKFTLNGNHHFLFLPLSNMPFFTRPIVDSEMLNMKLIKKSATASFEEHWGTTNPDFYDGNGVNLIFETLQNSVFQGDVTFDISLNHPHGFGTGLSLLGYNLVDSNLEINLKGNFSTNIPTPPYGNPALNFSTFYKGAGTSVLTISSNQLNLDLNFVTPDCADSSAGIRATWGLESFQPLSGLAFTSSPHSGTSNLVVNYQACTGPVSNNCLITSSVSGDNLICSPNELR